MDRATPPPSMVVAAHRGHHEIFGRPDKLDGSIPSHGCFERASSGLHQRRKLRGVEEHNTPFLRIFVSAQHGNKVVAAQHAGHEFTVAQRSLGRDSVGVDRGGGAQDSG